MNKITPRIVSRRINKSKCFNNYRYRKQEKWSKEYDEAMKDKNSEEYKSFLKFIDKLDLSLDENEELVMKEVKNEKNSN